VIEFVRGDLAAVGRTTLSHPDHGLRVTLYPVFHVGSPAFYAALSEDLGRFKVLLLEGVRWHSWRGPIYDLAARNLGLVTQRDHLRLPPDAERHPLDMTEAEFRREVGNLPFHWQLLLWFLRPVLWVMTATESGRHATWDTFSKRSYVRGLRNSDTPLDQLIKTKRDRLMSSRLRTFVQDPSRVEQAAAIAVVAGAGHMPVLYLTLRECGFEKGAVRWFEVLEGLKVPSKSTTGRASPMVV
jgi:hypothetical protein